jgi:Zn-dependent protease with chaperone function
MIVLPILLLPRLLHWISSEDASDNDAFDNSLLSLWGIKLDFYTPNPLSLLLFIVNAFCVHRTVNRSYGFTLLLLIPLSLVFHFIFVLLPPALATNGGNPSLMKGIALFIPLLNKVKFPLDRVFLQKNLVNAFVSGIGRFAIMVIGTGLRTKLQLTPLELRAVVGHELGHWALNHLVYLNLAFVLINITSLVIFVFLVRNRAFYRSFDINIGPEQPIPIGVGLVLATGFLQLFLFYYKPFLNILSQLFEYQADAFSVSLGQGADLLSAMPKMHPSGLKLADYLYGLFTSNHPVYSSRAAAIAKGIRH